MSNTQVTFDTDPNNARSESNIAINPNNPNQIVSGSKKFRNIQTYDFTLATQYSEDAGQTWHESADLPLPDFTLLTDPALAWDDAGGVYLVGLSGNNPPSWDVIGIEIYKSTDGGKTWSNPTRIHINKNDDKQWAAGDSNPASPFHGNIYAVWDDSTTGSLFFARTCDHGATWVGAGSSPAGSVLAGGAFAAEIDVAEDGTVYLIFMNGNTVRMLVSKDGGGSFQPAVSPAAGVTILGGASAHFPGETFRAETIPTASVFGKTVAVAWSDMREGASRVYWALSNDGGASWTTGTSGQPLPVGPIPTGLHHFDPQVVIDPTGVIGVSFYEFGPKPTKPLIDVIMARSFDGGATFEHFTVTDQPWDPALDAPLAHGVQGITFIGDYFGLDASAAGFYPLWTDTRTGIQELFVDLIAQKTCAIIVNRSTIGQDEVDARRNLPGGPLIPDALRVKVDGFTAAELGLTDPDSTLAFSWPGSGVTIVPRGNAAENLNYGPEVQLFTFFYDLNFGPDDTAFSFGGADEFITLNVSAGSLSAQAQVELIKQPDPFLLHGDVYWLSVDLRVFTARAGESLFGVRGISDATDAPRFIQDLMTNITPAQFDSLSPDEDQSKLYLEPADENGKLVFNFALAKVHYIGQIGAAQVRVFFRMFQAQTTNGTYDYPPGAKYRRADNNPHGQPIPLAGIVGAEYVTIPFFADRRIDTVLNSMAQQTDDPNVRNIAALPNGAEVDTFFGCWLDINQPFKPDGSLNNVLPATAFGPNPDGPFNGLLDNPLPLQQAIFRGLHQCLIAEIAFDPVSIPLGKNPADWDKLAQRNIAWADVGSASALTTFEIQPTALDLPAGQPPDELMIDWGSVPHGTVASIYLPAASANEILNMANRMYTAHRLSRADAHTLRCKTGGVTYIPIPPGSSVDYAGLLSVDLPSHLPRDESYTVAVRQVTSAFLDIIPVLPQETESRRARRKPKPPVKEPAFPGNMQWRRVLGAFQLTIPVRPHGELLRREERDLAVLEWIGEAIPPHSRWQPVYQRYLEGIKNRVTVFGGDPGQIQPSPTGDGQPHRPPEHEKRVAFTGRISGLVFDRSGGFDGFLLDTEDGERRFFSRERDMRDLAERAWRERLRLTVYAERDEPHEPLSIVLHEPQARFKEES